MNRSLSLKQIIEKQRSTDSKTKKKCYVNIPFINDKIHHKITQITRSLGFNVQFVHKSRNTLKSYLSEKTQLKTCKKHFCHINDSQKCFSYNIVYKITCAMCYKFYIGSTTQYFHDRVHQHHYDKNSAIFEHSRTCYNSKKYNYSIISKCDSQKQAIFSEAILIKQMQPSLNRKHEMEDVLPFYI